MRKLRSLEGTVFRVHDHDHVEVIDPAHGLHIFQDRVHALIFNGPCPNLRADLEFRG